MSFDQKTRNALAKIVGDSRRVLHADLAEQLQGVYGLQPDGSALTVDQLTHLRPGDQQLAIALRAWQAHLAANGTEATASARHAAAFQRMAHEASFTTLNRLAAIRMAEVRGIVIESVGKGTASDGFRLFEGLANGGLGDRDDAYAVYLSLLFDELAVELGVLFERWTPAGRLFPRPPALGSVLQLLDSPHIAPLWVEDETIGWIYQYFNSKDEREAMRKASSAPRNSRELAVRNQFFTPRYVVEFLTDNTLGRLWYEMHGAYTQLVDECRSLVRPSTEVFPGPAGSEPPDAGATLKSAREEGPLHTSAYVTHRTKRDPRDLRILDPAVGSGHFLLRVYDLLEIIYEEAWADPESPPYAGRTLAQDYATLEDLRRACPEMILRYNLHGIDIDPRASQIAALALWLRAQRSYMDLGLSPSERPSIRRSNLVTAEPMPGETGLVDEFAADLHPRVLGELVRAIWDRMRLAGEAGALLRIDVDLQNAIASAKKQWQRQPAAEQLALFADPNASSEQRSLFDVSGISDGAFWDQAEGRVLAALADYTHQVASGAETTRRLFADDAIQGFAFIDLCRKSYDVVLMNPPFGAPAEKSLPYLRGSYPETWSELYAAFVSRSLEWIGRDGFLGCITSNLFLNTRQLRAFRESIAAERRLAYFVDLGSGVLDDATVDTGLSVYVGSADEVDYLDLTGERIDSRAEVLLAAGRGQWRRSDLSTFQLIDMTPFAFHLAQDVLALWKSPERLQPDIAVVATGNHTFDDFRFLRLAWEVAPSTIGRDAWVRFEKGGDFQPFLAPTRLVVDWSQNGASMRALNTQRHGSDAQVMQSSKYWFEPGLTFPHVSSIGFGPRVLPAGEIFSSESISVIGATEADRFALLGLLSTTLAQDLVWAFGRYRKIENRAVANLPIGSTHLARARQLGIDRLAQRAVQVMQQVDAGDECSPAFAGIPGLADGPEGPRASRAQLATSLRATLDNLDAAVAEAIFGRSSPVNTTAMARSQLVAKYISLDSKRDTVISYLVGVAFGRWGVRTNEPSQLPRPGDAFAELPSMPPAMAQWGHRLADDSDEPSTGVSRSDVQIPVALVDDLDPDAPAHPDDLLTRIRSVIAVLWPAQHAADAAEIESLLTQQAGSGLSDYFRRPGGFFADHLARYSSSRREAPIYWPLSTPTGSYTIWLYYPRMSDDVLYQVVAGYVDPKIADVERRISDIDANLSAPIARDAARQRLRLDDLRHLKAELADFRGELLQIAALPYRPRLDDGVLISAAPLHGLFRHPRWRSDLSACWGKLEDGHYDWSHLALSIWPDRVREACRRDRSIAIAHDLEGLYVGPTKTSRRTTGRPGQVSGADDE